MQKHRDIDKDQDIYEEAATVMLLAESKDSIQTLLLRRNAQLKFAGGNWVFPGGRIDPSDYVADVPGDQLLAAKNAAVRETMEETGLKISAADLLYFSRWIPPPIHTRRFNTWFFLATVDKSALEKVEIDGGEIHEHRWLTPDQGMSEHSAGKLAMFPPTYVSLALINRFKTVSDIFAHYRGREAFYFDPRLDESGHAGSDTVILYKGDAGYDTSDGSLSGRRHRVQIRNKRLEYFCDAENI